MNANKSIVIVFKSDGMGTTDAQPLRVTLARKFLALIADAEPLPKAICFYTDGVKLACAGSPVLTELSALEARGVAAVSCSVGVRETFRRYLAAPQEALSTLRRGARQLKRCTRMPVGLTGSVFDVATAEDIVGSGDAGTWGD